jgi:glycosyltransferase involved in cell wall biosynthesis
MKLLLLNYEYPPIGGGGGFGCEKLAQRLVKKLGYAVTVLTAGLGQTTTTEHDAFGVEVIRVPCSKNRKHRSSASFLFMLTYIIKSVFFVFKNRKKLSFDVISTQFALPTGPAGYVIAKILKTPNVLTLHGGELFKQPLELAGYENFIINSVVRFVIKKADHVMANSQDTLKAAQRFLGITRDIPVISTGFSPPDITLPPQKICAESAPVGFVMVSRLVERKGLNYLLDALAQMTDKNWHLTLVGDGPEQGRLEVQTKNLEIAARVTFAGFVGEEEKFAILSRSDVFVLPTLHEGLGLVYFEAMYCGLPIVTTNNGGQTDFLTHEENALLVPIRDTKALKQALTQALRDATWRQKCGARNREKIKTLYVENLMSQYDALFQKATRTYLSQAA